MFAQAKTWSIFVHTILSTNSSTNPAWLSLTENKAAADIQVTPAPMMQLLSHRQMGW